MGLAREDVGARVSAPCSPIRYLELDVTEDRVLRRSYCFRPNRQPHAMGWETAKAAVGGFLAASGHEKGDRRKENVKCEDVSPAVPLEQHHAVQRVHSSTVAHEILVRIFRLSCIHSNKQGQA